MKYIIKYYRKEKGVWKYDVKLTTDFDLLIKYLKKSKVVNNTNSTL